MKPETIASNQSTSPNSETPNDFPTFSPEQAKKLRGESFFDLDPDKYSIFSQQAGVRENPITKKMEKRTLSIHETLGLMVGRTAGTIAKISGENGETPADHVIYLDKSARPVSWLVNEFWDDFTDSEKPSESFLAIDRRRWFERMGIKLEKDEYIKDADGSSHIAGPSDVDKHFEVIKNDKELLARIRSLYIGNGIETENPDEIFRTPTVLDGKNLLIIDEVSRSGSTLYIAQLLLKAAIPELKSVNGHVFWSDNSTKNNVTGETQMGFTPVWYPQDPNDWRGRGVKDINPAYFEEQYSKNPTPENRALKYGSIVLGEPLVDPTEEPGQPSLHLRKEIHQIHEDYRAGHILPELSSKMPEKIFDQLEKWGVKFIPEDRVKNEPHAYVNLAKKRNQI